MIIEALEPKQIGVAQSEHTTLVSDFRCFNDFCAERCNQPVAAAIAADGSAWTSGNCDRRVLRGGAWDSFPQFLREANRRWDITVRRFKIIGFRVGGALTP
jgi:formylglycine-generating enzyme required for sulfatase activity